MYGFQPTAAHRLAQLPQQLADGGLVARMKSADAGPSAFGARGLSQLRDMVPKMAAMGFQQAPAPAPAPVQPPPADPRAAQLMAMIPRMEAMGFKQQPQQPQYLASGGLVRGPGTGTSDSIPDEAEPGTFIMPADSTEAIGPSALEKMGTVPVRLSDGEFKMPPEQVMALGTAVLKLFKDATHTPVNGVDGGQTDAEVGGARGFSPGAADRMAQMPEQLFADGGLVDNDVTRVGNSYSGGNVGGRITVNGGAPAGTFSENPANRMAQVPQERPNPAIVSMIRATPPSAAAALASPVIPQAPTPPAPMGWQARQDQRSAEVSAASITNRPEWSRASPTAPAPAPVAAGFQPASQQLGTMPPVGQPQLGFQPRRYADGGTVEDDLQKRLMQIPTGGPVGWNGGAQAPAAPAPASGGGSLTRAAALAAPAVPPAPQPAVERMASAPQDPGLGFQPGTVTTQSTGAAQGLARRSAADAMADMPNATEPVQAPTVRHSGNDWQARNDLRNAQVSASSITNNGGRFDPTGGKNPAALAYQAAVANDNAQRAVEPAAGLAAMQEASATNRATLQQRSAAAQAQAAERGAMDRTLITERGNNTRAGIAALGATESARLKAQQEGKAPPGYRYTADGNMEAIPGGPADLRENKESVQQGKDTQDIFSILNEARPLMESATGSYGGVALDKVGQAVGYATDGAKATAQLKALQGALVSKMPKMSGPQSDKDVLLYREMAGQIGDPTIPVEQRQAAMNTIENLNVKYLPPVQDAAGYAAIPSGAYYKTPAGEVRRKP